MTWTVPLAGHREPPYSKFSHHPCESSSTTWCLREPTFPDQPSQPAPVSSLPLFRPREPPGMTQSAYSGELGKCSGKELHPSVLTHFWVFLTKLYDYNKLFWWTLTNRIDCQVDGDLESLTRTQWGKIKVCTCLCSSFRWLHWAIDLLF